MPRYTKSWSPDLLSSRNHQNHPGVIAVSESGVGRTYTEGLAQALFSLVSPNVVSPVHPRGQIGQAPQARALALGKGAPAIEQHGAHSGAARAEAVGEGEIAAVERRRRGHPQAAEGVAEDRRIGLGRAHDGAHRDGGEAVRHAEAREDAGQAAVPVADHGEPHPGALQGIEGRQDVGEEREPQAVDEHRGELRDRRSVTAERFGQHAGAVAAQLRERVVVAAAVVVEAVEGDLGAQGGGDPLAGVLVAGGGEEGAQAGHGIRHVEKGSVAVEENSLNGDPGGGGFLHRPGYNPARHAAKGGRDMRGSRARIILALALVVVLAGAWVPVLVADHYANGPGGAEVGHARVDRGWEFVYHAIRLSRGARLGTSDLALDRARDVWAGSPLAESVELVYQDGAFTVPVPEGGTSPAPERRVAEPLSRLGWVVRGRVRRDGPLQMIGLLDYHSGRVAWNIRPLPATAP